MVTTGHTGPGRGWTTSYRTFSCDLRFKYHILMVATSNRFCFLAINTLFKIRCYLWEWVNLSKREEKDGVFQGLAGLLQGISQGRSPSEIPRSSLPARGNVLPDYFTQIYILYPRGFRIGPPKIYKRFLIGPPQVTLNLLPPEFHSQWILVYHGYYAIKATTLPIWNKMSIPMYTINTSSTQQQATVHVRSGKNPYTFNISLHQKGLLKEGTINSLRSLS